LGLAVIIFTSLAEYRVVVVKIAHHFVFASYSGCFKFPVPLVAWVAQERTSLVRRWPRTLNNWC